MDSYKRAIILCFFLASSLAAAPEDGRCWGWDDVAKMSKAQEDTLLDNGHLELKLLPFNAISGACRYDDAPASSISSSYCDNTVYNTRFKTSGGIGSFTFFTYSPTDDIDINVELSQWDQNQQYMPYMQILSYSKADFTNNQMTPFDDPSVTKFQSVMYCVANTGNVCANATMPISYSFRSGFTYLFTIYGIATPSTVGKFFVQMNLATQIWIEDFDQVANGGIPAGWYVSINPTTAPDRQKRSTWIVGDYDYMSSRVRSVGQNGIYEPQFMAPAGGPTVVQQFLGLNPTVPYSETNLDPYIHDDEYITTTSIDLTAITTAEFQFTATLDNQYREGSQVTADYQVSVQFSADNGATWSWLLGGDFPYIVTNQDSTVWLTYQYSADRLCGKVVILKFVFDQISRDTSRFFGIDRLRFLTLKHQMCATPYPCMKAQCNYQGGFGCSYSLEDSVCAVNNGVCTGSTCAPFSTTKDALGCRNYATCDFTTQSMTTAEMTTMAMTTEAMTTNEMTTNEMTTNAMTTKSMTTLGLTTDAMTTGNEDGDVKEDPIFMGFNNQKFEFDGVAGKIYNIYNDPYVNLNSLLTVANTETKEGTVMTVVGVSIGGHNISLSTSTDHGRDQTYEIVVDGVNTKIDSSITSLSGCVEIQYKDAILISTPLHKIFVYPHRHRKTRHINVEYFNIHIHHPDEDVTKIGGVLGQTASEEKGKADLNESDFVESSIFGREASRFYETKMMQC